MKDLPTFVLVLISFFVGFALLADKIADVVIILIYPDLKRCPPTKYDPKRPVGSGYHRSE